jgi:hypothetical protein
MYRAGTNCVHFSIFDRKPNACNDHVYHFYASESLNLIFVFGRQGVGGKGVIITRQFS